MPFDGRSPSSAVKILDTLSEFLRCRDLTWMQYPKT
jgi:hypothetical protein